MNRLKRVVNGVTNYLVPYAGQILDVSVCLYLALNILFASMKIMPFDSKFWTTVYFVEQDSGSAGWLVWLVLYLSVNAYRKRLLPIVIYSLIIFIWDIVSYLTNFGVNHPVLTGITFGAGTLIVGYFMILDLKQKWKTKD